MRVIFFTLIEHRAFVLFTCAYTMQTYSLAPCLFCTSLFSVAFWNYVYSVLGTYHGPIFNNIFAT